LRRGGLIRDVKKVVTVSVSDFGNSLVVTGGGLGDTLFHLPFIRSIQQQSSGQSIVLACKKGREIEQLFSDIDFVRSVLPIARDQDVSGQPDLFRMRKLTRQANIDSAFIFHKSSGIAIAMMMAGVGQRFGYYFKGGTNRFFLNRGTCVPKSVPRPAFMNHAALVMDDAGISYDYNDVRFHQPDHVVDAICKELAVDRSRPIVALGVNASADFKQWGGEKYTVISERLLKNYSCQVLLFGAGDVRDVADEIVTKSSFPERIIDLTDKKVPLNYSHALLQNCEAYIGNDSFGLNLAAMSSLPAIGIFAQGHHFSYCDWIKPVNSDSPDIHRITPDRVWDEFEKLALSLT
jgi:ADP-heptose:LPS heptosyltransferase